MKFDLINKNKVPAIVFLLALTFMPLSTIFAQYQVEQIDTSTALYKDFVVGPGKVELEIEPGQSKTVNITVANRMDETRDFALSVEDFSGSRNLSEAVVLLGDEVGPYSLKDFLSFEYPEFELRDGERAVVPVTVSIPTDAQPGGLYGSVIVGTTNRTATGGQSSAIVSRLGVLFFVRVPGEVVEEGQLASFSTVEDKKVFGDGQVDFRIVYENNGSVHLNPYGYISVKNILGNEVGFIEIEPWFSLPQSLRTREVGWSNQFAFGFYRADLELNRGYGDQVDSSSISFFVLPWKMVAIAIGIIFVLVVGVRFLASRFKISVNRK